MHGEFSRDWLRRDVGGENAASLHHNTFLFVWNRWVGRRMQREDLVDSTMGLLDSTFAPTTSRYLDACHSLAESVGTQVR